MPKTTGFVAASIMIFVLSGCATLYSTSRDWRLPGGNYVVSARMGFGLFTRDVTISVNGQDVLSGTSYFWADEIDMKGELGRFPITAVCSRKGRLCDVSIAGFHAATLNFDKKAG